MIEVRTSTWLGIASVAAIGLAIALALVPIGLRMGDGDSAVFTPYLRTVIAFTVWQALLSTLLSVGLGSVAGLALARAGEFPGRRWVLGLFALPLSVPALVAILGVVALFGDNGVLARLATAIGVGWPGPIYGLAGILIAHVFFNLPLVARFAAAALDAVPAETHRLADMLALPGIARFRFVEGPVIARVLPGAASLVFLLCLTSFAVALTLGGGPQATTIEVALYQAVRFDLDFSLAVKLAAVEVAIAGLALLALSATGRPLPFGETLASARYPLRSTSRPALIAIGLASLYVAAPIVAVMLAGMAALSPRLLADPALWSALATSLAVAAASAVLALTLGGGLSAALASPREPRSTAPMFAAFGSLTLVLPPMLLGAGWFLLLLPLGNPARFAAVAVVAANALMAVPYVVRTLTGPIASAREQHDQLATGLGIGRLDRLRLIDGPVLVRPLTTAGLLAMLVSLGDFGAIALFGNEDFVTLPTLLYQRMGNYRSADAAAIALVLLAVAALLTWIAGRLERRCSP